jgi:hypothetical protein
LDSAIAPLYPELMKELDALKRGRIGGLMLRRDWGDRRPWPIIKGDAVDLTHMPPRRLYRSGGFRSDRCGDASAGPAQVGQGLADLCEADDATGNSRRQKAARDANRGRTFVRMSGSPLVRMTGAASRKSLKTLERVKGIEPSSSAWKAVDTRANPRKCAKTPVASSSEKAVKLGRN